MDRMRFTIVSEENFGEVMTLGPVGSRVALEGILPRADSSGRDKP
jgi:hypothetical protein